MDQERIEKAAAFMHQTPHRRYRAPADTGGHPAPVTWTRPMPPRWCFIACAPAQNRPRSPATRSPPRRRRSRSRSACTNPSSARSCPAWCTARPMRWPSTTTSSSASSARSRWSSGPTSDRTAPPSTVRRWAAAVCAVYPAFELLDMRNCILSGIDATSSITDNAMISGVVLGPRTEAWRECGIGDLAGRLSVNGETRGEGNTRDALGHPLKASPGSPTTSPGAACPCAPAWSSSPAASSPPSSPDPATAWPTRSRSWGGWSCSGLRGSARYRPARLRQSHGGGKPGESCVTECAVWAAPSGREVPPIFGSFGCEDAMAVGRADRETLKTLGRHCVEAARGSTARQREQIRVRNGKSGNSAESSVHVERALHAPGGDAAYPDARRLAARQGQLRADEAGPLHDVALLGNHCGLSVGRRRYQSVGAAGSRRALGWWCRTRAPRAFRPRDRTPGNGWCARHLRFRW